MLVRLENVTLNKFWLEKIFFQYIEMPVRIHAIRLIFTDEEIINFQVQGDNIHPVYFLLKCWVIFLSLCQEFTRKSYDFNKLS
jgi:hypothetical protein